MISLYRDLIKGNHPIKRFHLLFFYFHKSSNDAIAIVCIFALFLARKSKKRSFSRNSIFSLLFFEYKRNFYMTLVSDNPHVASILRINISKLGCTLQANFIHAIALTSLRSPGSISLSSVTPYRLFSFHAIALTSLRSSGSISLSSVAPYRLISFYATALTSLCSSGSISLSSVAPYRLISCYAIALTSLRSSGSISLSSVAPYRLTSLRAIEKEHTVHLA